MKRALIIGIAGQDGYYLTKLLLSKNYEVFGIIKNDLKNEFIDNERVKISKINAINKVELNDFISNIDPDEIYQLAAHHFSSEEKGNFKNSITPFIETNLFIINNILEIVNSTNKNIRIFYASSCHIFGNTVETPQTENTAFNPQSFYSISKAAATNLCNFYRNNNNIYISVGIFYNHESIRRTSDFVTSKIAAVASKAFFGDKVILKLRNLNAILDWGAAEDYVKAMWLSLQQRDSQNYIISSGISRSIKDFAKTAFDYVGQNYQDYIFQDENVININNNESILVGDSNKIRKYCEWLPEVKFEDLVIEMVDSKIQEIINKNNNCLD